MPVRGAAAGRKSPMSIPIATSALRSNASADARAWSTLMPTRAALSASRNTPSSRWSVPTRRSPRRSASSTPYRTAVRVEAANLSNTTPHFPCHLFPVLGVHRLPGHAEGVPDLLPRPTLLPGQRDVHRFHLLGQSMQGTDRTQTGGRVGRRDVYQDLIRHGRQSSLTDSTLSTQTDRAVLVSRH